MENSSKVYLTDWRSVDKNKINNAIDWCGGWDNILSGTRVAIKPNLTFPFYKPGVTTPPDTIRAVTELLVDRGAEVIICEGGPSNDNFPIWDSFKTHGILDLRDEYDVDVVHLYNEPFTNYTFGDSLAGKDVPISNIINDVDVFITMPLVKVHAMTIVSLALKNQWALIRSKKRFLYHPALNDILPSLNAQLPQPLIVCDARKVLTDSGPIFGTVRKGNFLAVGNDPGAFDFVLCKLMGFDPKSIKHIKSGIEEGLIPESIKEISTNVDPIKFQPFIFNLDRSLQNYIALIGFNNLFMDRLLYDSFIGDLLHKLLYTVKGNPMEEVMKNKDSKYRGAENVW